MIKALHDWPYLLSQISEEAEERHKGERSEIETQLIKRKDDYENEIMAFDEVVQQVSKWGDLYGYRLYSPKINEWISIVKEFELRMKELS